MKVWILHKSVISIQTNSLIIDKMVNRKRILIPFSFKYKNNVIFKRFKKIKHLSIILPHIKKITQNYIKIKNIKKIHFFLNMYVRTGLYTWQYWKFLIIYPLLKKYEPYVVMYSDIGWTVDKNITVLEHKIYSITIKKTKQCTKIINFEKKNAYIIFVYIKGLLGYVEDFKLENYGYFLKLYIDDVEFNFKNYNDLYFFEKILNSKICKLEYNNNLFFNIDVAVCVLKKQYENNLLKNFEEVSINTHLIAY